MSTILVVEDERVVAKDLVATLTRLGYEVTGTASSSEEALQQAADRCPDLALMDIRIKGRIDGIATAQLLRSQFGVPVVYLTAYADDDTVRRAEATLPLGYLIKPFKPRELRATIEVALFRHQMERRLREREHWSSTTLRATGEAILTTDTRGGVTFMNLAAERLVGVRQEHALGQRLRDLPGNLTAGTRDALDGQVERALGRGAQAGTLPPPNEIARGGERAFEDRATPIIDDAGSCLGAVVLLRDLSEQRRLLESVALEDRLSSLATMATGIAHEINNPLTIVVASSAFVTDELHALATESAEAGWPGAERDGLGARLAEMLAALRDIDDATRRAAAVVADLTALAQRRDAGAVALDPRDAMQWALRAAAAELSGLAAVAAELGPVPLVKANDVRLGQVFLNLLRNAGQAVAGGNPAEHRIRVASFTDAEGRAALTVQDSGPGIADDLRGRIFDPFYSTKPGRSGAGLGLAVCRGIVKSFGGEINVDSAPGAGTTFAVILPAAPPAPAEEETPLSAAAAPRAQLLVIDDDPLIASAMRHALARDHDVTAMTDAPAALRLLRDRPRFDLVLCDLMMEGLSGMDLYERVLGFDAALAQRFVFVTGGAFTARAREFLDSVTNPVVNKPFAPAGLRALVERYLRKHPPAPRQP